VLLRRAGSGASLGDVRIGPAFGGRTSDSSPALVRTAICSFLVWSKEGLVLFLSSFIK
jgi:hypothetical protein